MTLPARDKITLIGAGLSGPLLAIGLRQRGFEVELYERRTDMRKTRISAGRSINLALSTRGIFALKQAGVWNEIEKILVPMKGRMMHSATGECTFQPYGKDDSEVIHSVSRAMLNIALMNAAEASGAPIHFQHRCTGFDLQSGAVHLLDELNGKNKEIVPPIVIATDGSGSAIRTEMLKLPRFDFSQRHLEYGYKELTIPPQKDGGHAMATNALHIWPRGSFMLIALPNLDGSFGCILFLPFEGEISFNRLASASDVHAFFGLHFPDALALMPRLAENFFESPVGSMVTVKCFPWQPKGRALLLGDAAHAIVPFFGQGLNCSFEDCSVLLELIDKGEQEWPEIFRAFQASRKENTDAIADLAMENFVEMRDRVADPRFLLEKKVELALQSRFPKWFIPRYAMVTFHRVPYSLAASRGELQDRILRELCSNIESADAVDWNKADELIHRELTPLTLSYD